MTTTGTAKTIGLISPSFLPKSNAQLNAGRSFFIPLPKITAMALTLIATAIFSVLFLNYKKK